MAESESEIIDHSMTHSSVGIANGGVFLLPEPVNDMGVNEIVDVVDGKEIMVVVVGGVLVDGKETMVVVVGGALVDGEVLSGGGKGR